MYLLQQSETKAMQVAQWIMRQAKCHLFNYIGTLSICSLKLLLTSFMAP